MWNFNNIYVVTCLFALLSGSGLALSQHVGDQVRLVEREKNIPAHSGPGDNAVTFRFASESTAEILAKEATTGWLQIIGEPVGGGTATGWITPRYIDTSSGSSGGNVPSVQVGWCPPKGSPDPHPSGRLRLATWNLANLHAQDGRSIFTGNDPSEKRFATDYERIRCYVRLFDPDILAVQEVDGADALQRVVDTDIYDIHVSQRPLSPGLGGQQNTGFAYKKGLSVQTRPDFEALDVQSNGRLRYGTRIDLAHNGQTVQLMSIHLKSGCFSNSNSGSACNRLLAQVPVLEQWIDEAANGPTPFILLGDFNRRFNEPMDDVWKELDDGQPANADLTTATENKPISCRDNQFTRFIDHIVFDKRAVTLSDPTSFRHMTYRQDDRNAWPLISDHCPVIIELWIP